MIIVKTKLGVKKIEGIGLFADEDIKKGTVVIKNNDNLGLQNILKINGSKWSKLAKKVLGRLKNFKMCFLVLLE